MRRRSASAAATMRAREARSSALAVAHVGERRLERDPQPLVVQAQPEVAGQLAEHGRVGGGEVVLGLDDEHAERLTVVDHRRDPQRGVGAAGEQPGSQTRAHAPL